MSEFKADVHEKVQPLPRPKSDFILLEFLEKVLLHIVLSELENVEHHVCQNPILHRERIHRRLRFSNAVVVWSDQEYQDTDQVAVNSDLPVLLLLSLFGSLAIPPILLLPLPQAMRCPKV